MDDGHVVDDPVFGWRADCSVRRLVSDAAEAFREVPYVLVTSLDSATDLRGFAEWLVERGLCDAAPETLVCDRRAAMIIDGSELVRWAQHDDVLVGFDEVWIFGTKPTTLPPTDCWLVAPKRLDEDSPSAAMLVWMAQAGCAVGLGDGYGTNFVATDIGLARRLHLADR